MQTLLFDHICNSVADKCWKTAKILFREIQQAGEAQTDTDLVKNVVKSLIADCVGGRLGIIDSAGFRRRVISEAEVNISTQIETGFGLYRVVQWDEFAERGSDRETTVKLERILVTTWLRTFVI